MNIAAPVTPRHKVLAVDDDPLNLEVMAEVLGDDYRLFTAADGATALALAERERPDVILLDIMMPGMSGYEVCRRLRTHPELRTTKVILVSAKAMTAERLQGYEAGADDYLTKPFDQDELLAKLRVYLRLKSAEELDALKGNLITLISHELRTPMTGILPAAELLNSREALSEDDRRMWAGMILEHSERLVRLMEQGLTLCELKTRGAAALNPQRLDLAALWQEVLAGATAAAADPGRSQVDAAFTAALPVDGDAVALRRTCSILLDNALGHARPGTPVVLRVGVENGVVVFSVENQAAAAELLQLAQVQDVMAPRVRDGQVVGGSLNLALARETLQAHGGELQLQVLDGERVRATGRLPLAG